MACINSCNKEQNECTCNNNGASYVCIIVLYILLAIIIGSFIIY